MLNCAIFTSSLETRLATFLLVLDLRQPRLIVFADGPRLGVLRRAERLLVVLRLVAHDRAARLGIAAQSWSAWSDSIRPSGKVEIRPEEMARCTVERAVPRFRAYARWSLLPYEYS